MVFSAIGRAARRNPNGSIFVKVEIMDAAEKTIAFRDYTGPTIDAIKALIRTDLDALILVVDDAALSQAVVGVLLGSA